MHLGRLAIKISRSLVLFYVGALMPSVNVRESEPIEVSVRRFKRACEKDNILADIRRHEFYEKPKWKRKRLKMAAVKRLSKKLMREKISKERGRVK